jgi:predicted ATPase
MSITFKVLALRQKSFGNEKGVVYLTPGDWDDYSFKTSFDLTVCDASGTRVSLSTVKVGYAGQATSWSLHQMTQLFPDKSFSALPDGWFSLGQDVGYYAALRKLSTEDRQAILTGLRDVVADEMVMQRARNEKVFKDSLTRGVSQSAIYGQFKRVLAGNVVLDDFHFAYRDPGDDRHAPVSLDFQVEAASKPSTNVHALIGRNGVGKTTLLNNMVGTILEPVPDGTGQKRRFVERNKWGDCEALPANYFSSVVSVSFSAFDPFLPPVDQPDRTRGVAYFYIGMKNRRVGSGDIAEPPKSETDLAKDFVESLASCLSQPAKRERWAAAIRTLESDLNFADMNLTSLLDKESEAAESALALVKRMSSGHSIVLLTMTKLVDTVEEKTLVLMDEPESHLHPPMLSAFTRALSNLLHDRNGVAIVATHSPVVLQEVPRSCVWKLTRLRTQGRSDRPERETFGENVGILTREVFGLEVAKSGFHELLRQDVDQGGSFEEILGTYGGHLGTEARTVLLSLIGSRDSGKQ